MGLDSPGLSSLTGIMGAAEKMSKFRVTKLTYNCQRMPCCVWKDDLLTYLILCSSLLTDWRRGKRTDFERQTRSQSKHLLYWKWRNIATMGFQMWILCIILLFY